MVEYTSLWAFGTDCISQEFVNRLALVHGGNGIFSWTQTLYSDKAAQFLCDELDIATAKLNLELIISPYDNEPYIVLKDYGVASKHDVRDIPALKYANIATLFDDYPWLKDKLKRRYDKMMRELKDPTAKPLFIFVGFGDGVYALPYNETYNPDRMRRVYEKLNAHFPADVGMLYIDYDPNWKQSDIHENGRFVAVPHPISYEKRLWKQRETVTMILNGLCPDLQKVVVPASDFEERSAILNPNIIACNVEHTLWKDALILDLRQEKGYRRSDMHDGFDILHFKKDAIFTVYWRRWKSVETFIKCDDSWLFAGN